MKIRYLTANGRAERVSVEYEDNDHLTLCFDTHSTGAVSLGGKIYPLSDGEARINLKLLTDGEYIPKLETEDGIYVAESFVKRGKSIGVQDADDALIRRLVERCYILEGDVKLMRTRLDKLERVCCGHNIFDFERKEHE